MVVLIVLDMRRTRAGDTKTAIGYLRVSTEDQRLGPDAQREAVTCWAAREGVRVVAWHEDHGVSGASPIDNRVGFCAALAAARAEKAGLIVVAKRDRIARDIGVAAMAERAAQQAGARLVSADGTANATGIEGVMLRGMFDVFAAVEREMIRSRTRAALATKKARGERTGEVPFGFHLAADHIHLEPDLAEQAIIAVVRDLACSGFSIRAIASELEAKGAVGRTGNPLGRTQVHRIVRAG